MKRWPYVALACTLAGTVAVVCCPHVPEPAESIPTTETEASVAVVPKTAFLRFIAKKLIAREVAEGQRSLLEAAALFGALNRLPPETPELSPQDNSTYGWVLNDPVRTEDERLCRQVVQWVDAFRLSDPPEYAAAAVARLLAEYRELHQHGAVRLPDPPTLPSAQELLERARKAMTEAERKAIVSPSERP
jgi:hypothetical protein